MTAGRRRARARDVALTGVIGLRTKPMRAALTALGIAIGIAAMTAVVGISASSRADLLADLDRLGTNRLQARAAGEAELPETAPSMVRRIAAVEAAAGTTTVDATIRRNHLIPTGINNGIAVLAADLDLLDAIDASMTDGVFLNEATERVDAVVLGSVAAQRLGLAGLDDRTRSATAPLVTIDEHWFKVVGILDPVPLAPDIERSALIGYDVAQRLFATDRAPSTIHVRTDPDHTLAVRSVVAPTANPESPRHVEVTRPSDLIAARAEVDDTLAAVLLGLGVVALVVGGVGIANVMLISVLERRPEIGVRRAVGATRGHIRTQFLVESVALAVLGGAIGLALGTAITVGYAHARGWPVAMPVAGLAGGLAAAVAVGALAGAYPATRASHLAPAEAIRSE